MLSSGSEIGYKKWTQIPLCGAQHCPPSYYCNKIGNELLPCQCWSHEFQTVINCSASINREGIGKNINKKQNFTVFFPPKDEQTNMMQLRFKTVSEYVALASLVSSEQQYFLSLSVSKIL